MHLLAALLLLPGAIDVWIFARTDCPVSNRYAPAIAKLHRDFSPRGVNFQLIYPEPGATQQTVDHHRDRYGLRPIPATLDAGLERVRRTGVRVTPEAVVFAGGGKIVYRGRIDDRQANLNVAKSPRKLDLEDAKFS